MTKKKPASKAMKVWSISEKYIHEVQRKHKVKTPQVAIDMICRGHAEVDRSPTERAQGKIQEATKIMDDESISHFLALVNCVLTDKDRALDLSREALLKIIKELNVEDSKRAKVAVQETLADGSE